MNAHEELSSRLEAAIGSGDSEQLLEFCEQLNRNHVLTAYGLETTVICHVARLEYGRDCIKLMIDKFGSACLTSKDNDLPPGHLAAEFQDEETLSLIYEALGDRRYFEEPATCGKTAAHHAAKNMKSISALKWLVKLIGPKCLRTKDENLNTPLHLAALVQIQGSEYMEFFKLEVGSSSFHVRNDHQQSVIHMAAMNENGSEALEWMVNEFGTDFLTIRENLGSTTIHLAAWVQNDACMKFIKKTYGSSIFTLEGELGETIVHSAAQNIRSCSALAWCVQELGPKCLLQKDQLGRTPIHQAARYQGDTILLLAVKELSASCLKLPDQEQQTAVHYAAMNQEGIAALRLIIDQLGTKCLMVPDKQGITAAHLVALYQGVDSLELIRASLGASAFRLLEDSSRRTLVHYAVRNSDNKQELVEWIVTNIGPKGLVVPDSLGITPAHIAGFFDYEDEGQLVK